MSLFVEIIDLCNSRMESHRSEYTLDVCIMQDQYFLFEKQFSADSKKRCLEIVKEGHRMVLKHNIPYDDESLGVIEKADVIGDNNFRYILSDIDYFFNFLFTENLNLPTHPIRMMFSKADDTLKKAYDES